METTRRMIDAGWRFKELEPHSGAWPSNLDWLPAQVPGHVHLDLERAGVVGDPFYRLQERGCAWVDETDWVYETAFAVDEPPPFAFLRFEGLDTVAEIALNGEELGRADNMFIPHEFPVGGRLRGGENTLRVVFRSALRVGRERQAAWYEAAKQGTHDSRLATRDSLPFDWFTFGPRSFVRKAQYMYGWDWGPELVSCGIWQPVELVTAPVARLLDWRYTVDLAEDGTAAVTVAAEVERAPGHEETPLLFLPGMVLDRDEEAANDIGCAPVHVPAGPGPVTVSARLTVPAPRLWWPNRCDPAGVGSKPALYVLHLSLYREDGTCDSRLARIGLRSVELVREPDADGPGEGFRFRVNGRDVFAKGANWIPSDSFPSRLAASRSSGLTPEEYANLPARERNTRISGQIRMAADAGFNMMRVWGGGLYESERFYALCDERGILVWQDFPYGCAYYPDTGEYADAARREATAAVRRIRNHPSLALWCGNNENQMFYHGLKQRENPPRFLGEHLYDEILPAVVRAEDPRTPYWPGSPFGGNDPNSPDAGDRHNWAVWHGGTVEQGDWTHYPDDDSRFVSEFGFSASCGMTAWDGCLAKPDRWPRSPAVRWHDKTRKPYETYLGYIRLHFPEPRTLEDLVYYSQLNQAEALKRGVEHYRRRKGRCWGALIWQLNDCWPVQSWSLVDYALEPKAAYYAAKRFYAPALLSLVRRGDAVEAHLTSDLPERLQGDVTVSVETFDGDVLRAETFEALAEAGATTVVGSLNVADLMIHARDVYVRAVMEPYWDPGLARPVENLLFLAEPKDLRLPDPGLSVTIEEGDPLALVLSARRFAPFVWLRLPGRGKPLDDNFFHLPAGETHRLLLSGDGRIRTADDARGALVIRWL